MERVDYSIIYSDRRTISLTVKEGKLTVRAPRGITKKRLEQVINDNVGWIEKKLFESQRKMKTEASLTDGDIKRLKKEARAYFEQRTKEISDITGLKYSSVKITSARTRFGSCSSSGNVCYSYRLMLYPASAREYVILHELAHTKEMNHSKEFYKIIEGFMPDYKERKRLLK